MISPLTQLASPGRLLGACLAATAALSVQIGQDPIDDEQNRFDIEATRTLIEQYVETQRIISEKSQAWRVDQDTLQSQIELLQERIAETVQLTQEKQAETVGADKDLLEKNARHEELVAAIESLRPTVIELETRTRALLPWLPEPLLDSLDLFVTNLPEDPATFEGSTLSKRLANVIAILSGADKWNRQLQASTGQRDVGGRDMLVKTIYIGLSVGYYATSDGAQAGTGRPTADGWVWELAAPEDIPAIARAIAVYEGAETPAFVRLPLEVE